MRGGWRVAIDGTERLVIPRRGDTGGIPEGLLEELRGT